MNKKKGQASWMLAPFFLLMVVVILLNALNGCAWFRKGPKGGESFPEEKVTPAPPRALGRDIHFEEREAQPV